LQIPANAALFYVLCGLAASKLLPESSKRRRSRAAGNEEAGVVALRSDNRDSAGRST
jgi:hypothetical protein